jgi:hypothetical protein
MNEPDFINWCNHNSLKFVISNDVLNYAYRLWVYRYETNGPFYSFHGDNLDDLRSKAVVDIGLWLILNGTS